MRSLWRYTLLGLTVMAPVAQAQLAPNAAYDGRVTLARLKYDALTNPEGCQEADSPAGQGWGHDYPMSVQGLLKAATELTSMRAAPDSTVALTVDDPELLRHPLAMLTEPGCWQPTDREARALRNYLTRGGFLVVDDPTFSDCTPEHCQLAIDRFEAWMERVLPQGRVVQLTASNPVFDNFFQLTPTTVPGVTAEPAIIMGIYQNNDPTRRLLVVAHYWTALGHMWRYVDSGLGSGIEQGGPSYQMGLNELMYGLSH